MNTTKAAAFAASVALAMAAMACSGNDSSENVSTAQKTEALVKCEGINECKGTSECKSADGKSGCQGLNECKGQGWVSVPAEECADKSGKVLGAEQPGATPSPPPAASPPAPMAKSVKCEGVNECKGTSECKSADNECKGHNECAGKGWIEIPSETECLSQGGKVIS